MESLPGSRRASGSPASSESNKKNYAYSKDYLTKETE